MKPAGSYDRLLFEKTVIGLALCRMDGSLVDVNSAFAELIGRSVEEALNLSYWEITPESYADQEETQLASLLATGRYGPYEKEYIHADGHLVPVRLSGQIVEIAGETFIWSSVEDITDRKQAEAELTRLYKQIEQMSFQDSLTGIANRRMFDQTLDREWQRAQRDRTPLSLIMLDIDHFKQYNDHYGHQQGDECLRQITRALSRIPKRAIDLFARYGGEEFAILLPETDKQRAAEIADQCVRAIRELQLPNEHVLIVDMVTISTGTSTFIPSGKTAASELIEAADRQLYLAKQNGRDRSEYQPGLDG